MTRNSKKKKSINALSLKKMNGSERNELVNCKANDLCFQDLQSKVII